MFSLFLDIDECLSSSCEGQCVNTEGGFVCECGPGMQLSADRHSCRDTDECLGTPCQQRCKNSIGSYRCSCRPGFHLHGNRHSCVDVNECRRPMERRVCHHSCHNTLGAFLRKNLPDGESCRRRLGPHVCLSGFGSGCCPGWAPSMGSGHCTLPLCSFGCGRGICIAPNVCSCQDGEQGATCPGCFHSGVIRAEGDVFSPANENCTVCVCMAGNVSCMSPECPPGPCQTPLKSDCCTCIPVRCYFHGRWYADGAVFSVGGDECTTCVCQNGEVECSFTPCPELDCPREEWWLGPGQCCFTCREPTPMTGCSLDDNGVEFPIGQIWSPGDPCELCICQADGSVSCKRTDCVDSCPHPIRIPGQCCPDCSAGCTYTGRIFYNNQTFPSVLDPCLSCICLLGSVACSPVDCPITCTYPFHPDGECCPVCRDCNYEGRKVVNGQVFTLDDEPCTQCTCQLGEVSCEKVPCQPACSDPSAPPGDCCPSCPDSLERRAVESGKAARSPRGDTEAPVNCSSCPGPPAALSERPVPHVLQLLFRTNVTTTQTLPTSPSGDQASPSPHPGSGGTFPGEPGASQPSPGPLILPRASTLPLAAPGAPGPPPVTPEPESSSGAQTATRQPSPPAIVLTEPSARSATAPSPSETPATLLRPRRLSPAASRLSEALAVVASPSPRRTGTSEGEESTG
ncbi:von Willebrand factor C and EGF domain-containing protein [Puma concolor]|uniref:von Willebrand factor C and EGF domain-containing protein n=1 Tax=Puma concolor TaxID=9696 RepID=A0A6P6H5T6_PUMCO|nr:von Willebrand factor C and EGF domain-containing protein [Puma concolor]